MDKEKKTRLDYIRDPKTNSPLNRPTWTWNESDHAYVEYIAQREAEKAARGVNGRGSNTGKLQELIAQEMQKLTPRQPMQQSQVDDIFANRVDDVVEYDNGDGNVTTRRV